MPYIKHKSVHATPKKMLQYILNGDKTSDMKYATGINTVTDVDLAYDMLEESFEMFAHERFYKYKIDSEKEKVRIHHYIQSFDPKENISPEEAHRIGLEWAKKVFGDERQVICATHIDKGHIHNHFAVAPYSQSGKHWNDNKETLAYVRNVSDEICKQHGVSVIENPKKRGGVKYKEWVEQKQGTSWKDTLRCNIDKLIINECINNMDDLLKALTDDGYSVRRGKYITIRPPNGERGVRLYRLGNGYSEQDLEYRVQNRDKEYSVSSIMQKYKGIQVEYALCLRKIQIMVSEPLPPKGGRFVGRLKPPKDH